MSLEFEKLTNEVETMAQNSYQRQLEHDRRLEQLLEKMRAHATDWERLEECMDLAISRVTLKRLRAARPIEKDEPLDAAVSPQDLPELATVIASDGSQIVPDHHAAYLYSLINIGIFVYFHGRGVTPLQFTLPFLDYPGKGASGAGRPAAIRFVDNATVVGLRRDQAEIEGLARAAWQNKNEAGPLLAILDQRLLYWPAVGGVDSDGSRERVLQAWQDEMTSIRESGGLLAGYIARSRKQSVITMLDALDIKEPGFDIDRLTQRDNNFGVTDAQLFALFLRSGQRSKLFVDVSQHNEEFRAQDDLNEVCFFYLNPGGPGRQIARVDIPMWVAQQPEVVGLVHALIEDQCRILGNYPYVLARADEIAVVGRQDQEHLNVMIENAMQRYGLAGSMTAKRSSKEVARAGRTRHEI